MSEDEVGFFQAWDEALTPLTNANSVLQLVTRAEEAGLLSALREPRDVGAAANTTGLDASTVATLCRALAAVEVLTHYDDTYALTPSWRALTDPGAFVPLRIALGGAAVEARLLRNGGSYFELTADDRVTYARSVSPDPFSDDLVAAFRTDIENDPDRAGMADGGRLLELGCGVAGRLLTTLRAMPKLTAVGVELTPDLADEAQRRADALGVSDRLEIVCTNAADYRSIEPFDFGFWSQFFFPAEAREGALRTLMECLRPGACVQSPLGAQFDKIETDPNGQDARDFAIWRTVLDAWGVPERDPAALVAEFVSAGFVDVAVKRHEMGGQRLRATRP